MKQNFLIIGASGVNGSEIVKLLKAQGQQIRTTTSKKSNSADQVHLDLATGEGLAAAFQNIDRVFMLSPAGFADQYKVLSPLIKEAKKQGVKKVVLMTALGVDANEASPLRQAELELEKSGLDYNIIRPNWFMENFNTFWVHGIKEQGKIPLPAENAKVSFIDVRDIAAVAVKLLTDDSLNNRAFNLTGSEAITHEQVAKVISEVAGKKVVYENVAPEVLKASLLKAGVPADYTELMLLLFSFVRAGYNQGITNEVKTITGKDPITFQQYAKDFKQAWV